MFLSRWCSLPEDKRKLGKLMPNQGSGHYQVLQERHQNGGVGFRYVQTRFPTQNGILDTY